MSKEMRMHLVCLCIQYRAELEGIAVELMSCKEYRKEKAQLEQLSDDDLRRECDWLCEMLYYK